MNDNITCDTCRWLLTYMNKHGEAKTTCLLMHEYDNDGCKLKREEVPKR